MAGLLSAIREMRVIKLLRGYLRPIVRNVPCAAPLYPERLYLHIGTHRTGTTSIQNFLRRNIQPLAQAGVFVPFGKGRHDGLFQGLFRGEQTVKELSEDLHTRAQNQACAVRAIVLSDEDVSKRLNLQMLQEFREYFDVRVLFSVRRQDIWLESWYFQNIKWQWDPELCHSTWDAFVAVKDGFHWIDYDNHLTKLEELFGQENIQLTVFEKDQMSGGPVVEFCRQIGIEDLSEFNDPLHVNASMSAQMIEYVRHLPLNALDLRDRASVRGALEHADRITLGHHTKQSERVMPFDQRVALLDGYEAGNRAVAQRYFGRNQLFFDPLPDPSEPLAVLRIPESSEELMKLFVGPMLREMGRIGVLKFPDEEG